MKHILQDCSLLWNLQFTVQLTLNSLVLLHSASWGLGHHLFPNVLVLIDKFVQTSVRILAENNKLL